MGFAVSSLNHFLRGFSNKMCSSCLEPTRVASAAAAAVSFFCNRPQRAKPPCIGLALACNASAATSTATTYSSISTSS